MPAQTGGKRKQKDIQKPRRVLVSAGLKDGRPASLCRDNPIADEACRGKGIGLSIGRGHCWRRPDRLTLLARACSH